MSRLLGCRPRRLGEARPGDRDHLVDGQVGVFAPQSVDPDLIRLALVVAALQREHHVLAADGRMNADIDLPQLPGQTVGEHLRFDDTDPGCGELPLD
jgi:hypothetical protein